MHPNDRFKYSEKQVQEIAQKKGCKINSIKDCYNCSFMSCPLSKTYYENVNTYEENDIIKYGYGNRYERKKKS